MWRVSYGKKYIFNAKEIKTSLTTTYCFIWNIILIRRIFIPLPKITNEGYRVNLNRLRNNHSENLEFFDYVKSNFMSLDLRISKLDMFKKEIFIFDLNRFTMNHLTKILPHMKKFVYCATVSTYIYIFIKWNFKFKFKQLSDLINIHVIWNQNRYRFNWIVVFTSIIIIYTYIV